MTATVRVPLGDASYDIVLGQGILAGLPDYLQRYCPAAQYAVITDSSVAPLYGREVASAAEQVGHTHLVAFPAGEWNKNRETWADLTDQLLRAELDRDAVVIALGGGVVGDLAGFVAATYLRGVRCLQVPTSLLAMIDSAIGGKTGVDTEAGKNLVGAFHQPEAVVADVATLSTLPPVQLAAGMAEALKHGVIADADYFARMLDRHEAIGRRDLAALFDVVRRSVEIKAAVVGADERERGKRSILNFGHTMAHALETAFGYELLHGEAVAIGMVAEAELGEEIGISQAGTASQVRKAVEAFDLPTAAPGRVDRERLLGAMRRDKKARDGTVRFALPARLGEMARGEGGEWTVAAPERAVRAILERIG
ncbi:MAG: 3-dehydroquinate synthase [Gemmatimonadota bacterium]|nr:MAG: 3-dehydroquinate synthase [Gemmatimonadota bacterium]